MYRSHLNGIPLTPSEVESVVAEANVAFLCNIRLFEELDVLAGHPGASVQPLQSAMEELQARPDTGNDKCPFGFTSKAKGAKGPDLGHAAMHQTKPTKVSREPPSKCPFPFILLHKPMAAWRQHSGKCTSLLILVLASGITACASATSI